MSGVASPLAIWAVEALVASALLMALVLLVRMPVRRAFGPLIAYALWSLPVLRLILPPIPSGWHQTGVETPISRVGETITVAILPAAATADPVATVASGAAISTVLLIAWAVIAAGFLAFHLARHLTFCRRILARGVTIDRIARVRIVESDAAAGPMAFGVLRPCVAFPSDFAERFDADERALALAHELGHHARGDLVANWIALAVLSLHWFNPLAWRAFRTFRADQELANDARVLAGRSSYERHAYACAIVKAAHGRAVGVTCHLHSVKDLKGRLKMLRTQISPRRLFAGAAAVATFSVAVLGLTASGTRAAEQIRSQVSAATGVDLTVPMTLESAMSIEPSEPLEPIEPISLAHGTDDAATTRRIAHDVAIVGQGATTADAGDPDRRHLAALPPPVPPVPSVPPRPPVSVPSGAMMRIDVRVPQVTAGECGGGRDGGEMVRHTVSGGREEITVCTDRIDHQVHTSQTAATYAHRMKAMALAQALAQLQQARASVAANRALAQEARAETMQALEESMRELRQDMAEED